MKHLKRIFESKVDPLSRADLVVLMDIFESFGYEESEIGIDPGDHKGIYNSLSWEEIPTDSGEFLELFNGNVYIMSFYITTEINCKSFIDTCNEQIKELERIKKVATVVESIGFRFKEYVDIDMNDCILTFVLEKTDNG